MNWKEFLKPERRKLIIVFIAIFSSLAFLIASNFVHVPASPLEDTIFKIIVTINSIFYIPLIPFIPIFQYLANTSNLNLGGTYGNILYLIVEGVSWYFISCLIIWIYNKVKK